jgi:transposase-like protein
MSNVKALKPRQLSAIQLLACGTPACRVAERLEVSTMTLYRWSRQPEFEAKLRSITSSGLEEVAKKMNATTLTAVETLQEILCDMTQPTGTRLKAALGVLAALPSVSSALEKGLQHRVADFDLNQRWSGKTFTFDSSGNPIEEPRQVSSDVPVTV